MPNTFTQHVICNLHLKVVVYQMVQRCIFEFEFS